MPHFFASDLTALAVAFLLGIPLILVPGYALGWWLNLFQFQTLPAATRWSLAVTFGLTMVPILLYLPFRLFSVHAMWATMALLILGGLAGCTRGNSIPKWRDITKSAKFATLIWLILGTCLMLDLTAGSRLYPSTVIVDTSFRSQVISALANATQLPVPSYFFYPGHEVPLRYHYMYFINGAMMLQIGHGLVTAGMALVSLSLWTVLGLFAVLSAVIRFLWPFPDRTRATTIAWVLLAVDGLDLLPAGIEMIWRRLNGKPIFIHPDIGLWNGWGATFSWLSTAIWSTHHLGGLMACLLGCTLLWHSRESLGTHRWTSALGAALAFATAAGTSVYVTAIFVVFLFVVLIELLLNAPRYASPVVFSGAVALVLALPFLMEVKVASSPIGSNVFHIAARPFVPISLLYSNLGIQSSWLWNASYLAALPINFLIEFGVFFVGGVWWLWQRRNRDPELRYRDDLIIGLSAVSLIIPSMICSGMEISNDLGFRGVLPAQFVLLLCTTELLARSWCTPVSDRGTNRLSQLALIFLAIGIGSNLIEIVTLRGAIGTTAKETILLGDTMREDTSAERLAQLRAAYIWIRHNTPETAVIQENPVTTQMVFQGEYSQRRTAVYGSNPSFMFGEDHSEYFAVLDQVRNLFALGANSNTVSHECVRFGLKYLVVQSGDPAWSDPESYVWQTAPDFSTSLVRVFHCGT